MTAKVAAEVRRYAATNPNLPAGFIADYARHVTGAAWLDGHEVRRILDRKPKGAPRFTDRQLGNAVRMRDEGATWPEIAAALHCDRHTASKYVRAAQQARGQR